MFWSRLDNARDRLYDWVGGQRVLVESRTIDPFPELLDQAMAGFLLGMALTIPLPATTTPTTTWAAAASISCGACRTGGICGGGA